VGITWHNFGFLGPTNIWWMNEARNFKFGTEMEGSEYLRKNEKLGQKV